MKNTKKIFYGKLVLVCFIITNICGFSYAAAFEEVFFTLSSPNSRTKTFHDANATITKISMLGYNTERLQDILTEAISQEDDKDFFRVIGEFKNTTNILNDLRKKAYYLETEIEAIKLQNISVQDISEELGEAEANLVSGRYEEASKIIESVSGNVKAMEFSLINSLENRFDSVKSDLSTISEDADILSELEKQISSLDNAFKNNESENEESIKLLNLVIGEISQLEESLVYITELNEFSSRIKSLGVNSTEAEDVLGQVYYFIKEEQYEKSLSLLEESQNMIASEKKARESLDDTQNEINSLPESSNKKVILIEFNKVKERYLSGNYDEAKKDSDLIVKKVWDIKSELIQSQSVKKDSFSISLFLKDNLKLIIIISASLVVLWLIFRGQINRFILRKKIKHYETKRERIYNIMKGLQERYYVQKNISKLSYQRQIRQSELRYADIVKELALMKGRLK